MASIQKQILIAPLDWGLGHATRLIPLINDLLKTGYEVILAGSGSSLELLKIEFPNIKYYNLPSVSIRYSKDHFFLAKMLLQLPGFILNIRAEKKAINKIIKKEQINLILSDNRYGVFFKDIPSIFISHQIFPKLPNSIKFLENLVFAFQNRYIKKFQTCLIPDYKDEKNLSGELSHLRKLPEFYKFIGAVSRFKYQSQSTKEYDILVILSGPEPQKSLLLETLYPQLKAINKNTLIILGEPKSEYQKIDKNIKIVSHLNSKQMEESLSASEVIISRAGYTTIMDFVVLKKKAVLIPTPGQTEQLYLAQYLANKNMFVFENQRNINFKEALKKLENIKPIFDFPAYPEESFLEIIKKSFPPEYLDSEKCKKTLKKNSRP